MATQQAYIGYHNIIEHGNVAADSSQENFPPDMMTNPATNLRWKSDSLLEQSVSIVLGGQTAVNYIGIAGHNFGTGGVAVEIQAQDDDGGEYVTIVEEWTPSDDRPILVDVPENTDPLTTEDDGTITGSVTATYDAGPITEAVASYDNLGDISIRYYRIRLNLTPSNSKPEIAVVYAGEIMQLERGIFVGHTPITYARDVSSVNGMSENGQFLGRVIRATTRETQIKIANMTPGWYRETFEPFIAAATHSPFFFAWRKDEYPLEVGYCWLSGGVPVPENTGPRDFMGISFKIGGLG